MHKLMHTLHNQIESFPRIRKYLSAQNIPPISECVCTAEFIFSFVRISGLTHTFSSQSEPPLRYVKVGERTIIVPNKRHGAVSGCGARITSHFGVSLAGGQNKAEGI